MDKKQKAQHRIDKIKNELFEIGPMRPGKLSRQKRKDRNGKLYGEYWQLGYSYKMKSRSHYIPDDLVEVVQAQNLTYRKFKKLTEEWIDLALLIAENDLARAKKKTKN